MDEDPPFTITNKVVCDDVRLEATGKYTLVGVYSGNILVPQFPVQARLAAFCEAYLEQLGDHTLYIRVLFGDTVLGQAQSGITIRAPEWPLPCPFPPIDFAVEREGVISFQLSLDGDLWTNAISRQIVQNPGINPPPTA